jgi:hypothetical protein
MSSGNHYARWRAEMASMLLDNCSAWIREQDSGILKIDGLQ